MSSSGQQQYNSTQQVKPSRALVRNRNGLSAAAVSTGTGTASAGAVTVNALSGVVTSESLTTAAGSSYTCTITNSQVLASTANVLVSLEAMPASGNSAGTPIIKSIVPAAGSVAVSVINQHASAALNGAIKFRFHVVAQS